MADRPSSGVEGSVPTAGCTFPPSWRALAALSWLLLCGLAPAADKVVLVAGGGKGEGGGPAVEAKLQAPFGIDGDRAGNLYFVEMTGNRVGKIDGKGLLTWAAGTGRKGDAGDGGPPLKAEFNGPHGLAVTPAGDLLLADTWNNRVRKLDARSGLLAPLAGTGDKGFAGDGGPAEKARFGGVYCLALAPGGDSLYLADLDNRRVRKIDLRTNVVTTVAGNGDRGVPNDGDDAARAPLVDPRAVAADAKGNVWILERAGHALRVVDARGKIRTVVGTGKAGSGGDGGDGKEALLNGPKHLCVDRDGSVVIADTENHLIRRYLPDTGKIVRVAGTGTKGAGGVGGPPGQLELYQPHGVWVDAAGVLYICDSTNNRILKVVRGS